MAYIEILGERKWESADSLVSQEEVGDFLYGLVRLYKPLKVLETGCYKGAMTKRIGEALKKNGCGKLLSCDTDPSCLKEAFLRTTGLPVDLYETTGEELCAREPGVWMAYLDSGGNRIKEALALRLRADALVVLHDSNRRGLQEIISKTGWAFVTIPDLPRGLAVFQKLSS